MGSTLAPGHADALEHIHALSRTLLCDEEGLTAQEAASALSNVRLDYSSEKSGTTSLASYCRASCVYPTTSRGRLWSLTLSSALPVSY